VNTKLIRLHLSEAPTKFPRELVKALREEIHFSNLYPNPGALEISAPLAKYLGVSPNRVVAGNGCDELILRVLLANREGGVICYTDKSYTGYTEISKFAGVQTSVIPLLQNRVDLTTYLEHAPSKTAVAIVCNPHNPTGQLHTKSEIIEFVSACGDRDILPVVDESYIEFADPETNSVVGELEEYRHVILRSFSKSHAAAGLRLGVATGDSTSVELLKSYGLLMPFNVNRVSQRFANELGNFEPFFRSEITSIIRRRDWFQNELWARNLDFFRSNTNFVLLRRPEYLSAAALLNHHGIEVKDAGSMGFPEYWRVSIGTQDELLQLMSAMCSA